VLTKKEAISCSNSTRCSC
jgi:hypothetical protein